MADMVGPFRTEAKLRSALRAVERLKTDIGEIPFTSTAAFDPVLVDWLTCATCCWSRNRSRRRRSPNESRAHISGKIIPVSMTTGASINA